MQDTRLVRVLCQMKHYRRVSYPHYAAKIQRNLYIPIKTRIFAAKYTKMKRYLLFTCLFAAALFIAKAQEAKNEINFTWEEQKKAEQENQYKFSVTYRLQVGYLQEWYHSKTKTLTYPDLYLFGPQLGATFDFNLPQNFSLQTGLLYSLTYGVSTQHWRNLSTTDNSQQYIKHKIMSHQLTIPVRTWYKINLWRELALSFYTGPEMSIGVAQSDNMETALNDPTHQWLNSKNVKTEPYDRYAANELQRFDIQYGLGGAIQWANYRLQGGYSFGLNNLVKQNNPINQHTWNWSWNVIFSYAF